MSRWRTMLQHAFAVPGRDELVVSDETRALVDRVCRAIVARQMVDPALLLLEMSRPLNYVSAQALHALTPFLGAVADPASVTGLAKFLEQRGSVEYVCDRLEQLRRETPASPSSRGTPEP